MFKIVIDGEVFTVEKVHDYGYPMVELDDKTDWYIFQDSESAGEAAREYWENLAQDDPREFTCLVGEKTLVAWALGQYAGPGSTSVKSLEEWLDLWLDLPEEQWGSYDGSEQDCRINNNLLEELEFESNNCVCYRHN
jgi:hypothetical protein